MAALAHPTEVFGAKIAENGYAVHVTCLEHTDIDGMIRRSHVAKLAIVPGEPTILAFFIGGWSKSGF